MNRREFIKTGICGLTTIALGSTALGSEKEGKLKFRKRKGKADLTIESAMVEMVDRSQVFMWLFGTPALGPSFPGPVITVEQGYTCTITITNKLNEPHSFQILGTNVNSGPINPGQTATVNFVASVAGTYMYIDPMNAPVNRVLGLHGALVVVPVGRFIPYNVSTPSVNQLFKDLGTTDTFPGSPWVANRSVIWVLCSIDPDFNLLAQQGKPIDPAQFSATFLPRYFTLNGKSGYFATHDPNTALFGNVGEPLLVRIMNGGLADHSMHLHANHFFVTAVNGQVRDNVYYIDTTIVRPLDRVDWLVPFIRPPDIPVRNHPGNPRNLLRIDAAQELRLTFGDVPQSPLEYPMHCHMEMSQTAAGGNYPLGLTTHFTFTGDVDGVPFP